MLEVEIKAECADLKEMRKRLLDKGASFHGRREQVDIYLSHPSRDFGKTDEALRLRLEQGAWTLYYKGPRIDKATKSREEISTPIGDVLSFRSILDRLGFGEVMTVRKERSVFKLGEVEVSLDSVEGLGDFVEIEVMSDDLDSARSLVLTNMRELGLEKTEKRSYLELLKDKRA